MDPDDVQLITDLGTLLLALLALAVSAVAAGYSRGQRDATERQAVAAEAQVEVMRKQLTLMEQQSSATPEKEALPYVPPWVVRHLGRYKFAVVNGGTAPEYDVKIELSPDMAVRGGLEHESIGPRAAVNFQIFNAHAVKDDTIKVSWAREPGGSRQEWTTALPG